MKRITLLTLCAVLPLSACVNTRPVRDPARFYVIAPSVGAVESIAGTPSIGLRGMDLPDYLSQRKIALRRRDAEIVYRTYDLWGESLRDSATRTLAGRIGARIGRDHVDIFPWTQGVSHEVELRVQFDHFEGTESGHVHVSGRYILTPVGATQDGSRVVPFDYQGKWDKSDYATLARALGDGLDRLAAEILEKASKGR